MSGRFLSDLFGSLERQFVPATQLLGDLPIPIDEAGRVTRSIEWDDFAAFMRRLELHVGGPEELELCGQRIGEIRPAGVLRSLAGFSASPYALYRAASQWALRRAIPGLDAEIRETAPNQIEICVRIKDGLRACPQLFHLGTGGARALPRILGMSDAVVSAEIEDDRARYRIVVPPSRTLWARIRRVFRTIFSTSSVLQYLEAQQLELHEKHQSLQRTNAALAESERRYRAITDTAADVLCEINQNGQIEYVSASIEDLLGYTPEQVTGSHFSLWVAAPFREIAKQRLEDFAARPIEQPIERQRVRLHTDSGDFVVAELSLRSYRTPEGDVRLVGILRDQTESTSRGIRSTPTTAAPVEEPVSATARMTRIVENAMVQAPHDSTSFRWLETEKLVDMVAFEFHARSAVSASELQIDLSRAPARIWGDESLLATGLGNLLGWAADVAEKPPVVSLFVEAGERVVLLTASNAANAPSSSTPECFDEHAERARQEARPRRLAAAEDAVHALGGVLARLDESSGARAARIELPQPRRFE